MQADDFLTFGLVETVAGKVQAYLSFFRVFHTDMAPPFQTAWPCVTQSRDALSSIVRVATPCLLYIYPIYLPSIPRR